LSSASGAADSSSIALAGGRYVCAGVPRSTAVPPRSFRSAEHLEQLAYFSILDKRMPQRKLGLDLVMVSPAMSLAQHITLLHKFREDLVCPALGDANGSGDVAQADPWVGGDAEQDVSVIGEEIPAASGSVLGFVALVSRIIVHENMV
jgi:hypothetical protein